MEGDIHQQLGNHEASIRGLAEDMREIKGDVKMILQAIAQAKGGWKMLLGVATVGGACGAVLTKILPFLRFP